MQTATQTATPSPWAMRWPPSAGPPPRRARNSRSLRLATAVPCAAARSLPMPADCIASRLRCCRESGSSLLCRGSRPLTLPPSLHVLSAFANPGMLLLILSDLPFHPSLIFPFFPSSSISTSAVHRTACSLHSPSTFFIIVDSRWHLLRDTFLASKGSC